LLTLSGCFVDDIFDCEKGTGGTVSEEFNLKSFDRIKLNCPAVVYLSQGDSQEVIVEGQQNIINLLDRDVKNGKWEIEFDRCVKNYERLYVYITVPDIEEIRIAGSGEVESMHTLIVENLDLKISGSGTMDLSVICNSIDGSISGSGNMHLEGEADYLDFLISGSGDLSAFNLFTLVTEVTISGSGDARVNVEDVLKVRISGSGDVYYRGYPDLDVRVSGSGDVYDRN
jgi:hypothetical protein